MASVEISVGHTWKENVRYLHELRDVRPSNTHVDLTEIRDIIDIVVDGRNITSTVDQESVFAIVSSLVDSLVAIAEGRSQKAIVEFSCEPWELVLLPTDQGVRVSLYSVGRHRRVVAHEVEADAETLHRAVITVASSMLEDLFGISRQFATDGFVRRFSDGLDRLRETSPTALSAQPETTLREVGTRRAMTSSATGLSLEYAFDGDYAPLQRYGGEHPFDLHALLVPGRVEAEWRGRRVALTDDYPFLTLWGLLDRSRVLLEHLETASDEQLPTDGPTPHLSLEIDANGRRCGLEMPADGDDEAVPDGACGPLKAELPTVEALDVFLTLAEMLAEDLLEINARLELNHRLLQLQRKTTELRQWFDELSDENSYLECPERYLENYAHVQPAPLRGPEAASFGWALDRAHRLFARRTWEFSAARIFMERIVATPGGLLVPSDDGLDHLDAASGEARWSRRHSPSPPSFARAGDDRLVATHPDGGIVGLGESDGRVQFTAPQVACGGRTPLLGASYFPQADVTIACDRQGCLAAIGADGEVAWTFEAGHGRFTGVAWGGPLVSLLSEEGFFYALAPTDGRLLWKVRLGGLACRAPHFHQGRLYTLTRDPAHRRVKVHAFYPFSGRTAWEHRLEGTLAGEPNFSDRWLLVPLETPEEAHLCALDVEQNRPKVDWRHPLRTAGLDAFDGAAELDVDGVDALVYRTDCGELTCAERATGRKLWQTSPEQPAEGRFVTHPPTVIDGAVLSLHRHLEIRRATDGTLLHVLELPVDAAEFALLSGQLNVVLGEPSRAEDAPDRLVAADLNHFLAEVQ